tara:strand:- start:267 stop:827 length:561 start_codon:yes stop_codon:yes gene_type:complete
LEFNFGVQNAYLLSSTLAMNFTLKIFDSANNRPNNDNQNAAGGGAVQVLMNDKIAAMSVIQSITLSSSSNTSLEYVRNYPRLLASLVPARANFEDYTTVLTQQFGAAGNREAQGMINNYDIQVSAPLLCGMFSMGDAIPLGAIARASFTETSLFKSRDNDVATLSQSHCWCSRASFLVICGRSDMC